MLAKEAGHPNPLGHVVVADPLENVILRYVATRGQGAALRRDGFDMLAQCHFLRQQGVARGAILGALVRIREVRHRHLLVCAG